MNKRQGKLQRWVRREANKLLARRRYREVHDGTKASVWTMRVGPGPQLPEKAAQRAAKRKKPEAS